MITQEQYEHARMMISVLDMNEHEEDFHRFLEIALDYEIAEGRHCGPSPLIQPLSRHHKEISKRALSPITGIL